MNSSSVQTLRKNTPCQCLSSGPRQLWCNYHLLLCMILDRFFSLYIHRLDIWTVAQCSIFLHVIQIGVCSMWWTGDTHCNILPNLHFSTKISCFPTTFNTQRIVKRCLQRSRFKSNIMRRKLYGLDSFICSQYLIRSTWLSRNRLNHRDGKVFFPPWWYSIGTEASH